MIRSELLTLVGDLTNDPNHDRYSSNQVYSELDNTQTAWNIEIKIIKDTVTLTVVDGTRQYALTDLTGTPIDFPRVTHKGILIEKRSKQWFDLYSGADWTVDIGTPKSFFIEQLDPAVQYLTLHPTPQAGDAGANLVVEYIKAHTSMSSDSDVPFLSGSDSNYILRPYDWGLAYDASARLLLRDPSEANAKKSADYGNVAAGVRASLIQVFKALEAETPKRVRGGRTWNSGNIVKPK